MDVSNGCIESLNNCFSRDIFPQEEVKYFKPITHTIQVGNIYYRYKINYTNFLITKLRNYKQ